MQQGLASEQVVVLELPSPFQFELHGQLVPKRATNPILELIIKIEID